MAATAGIIGATASVAGAANSIFGGSGSSAGDAAGYQDAAFRQQAADLYNNLNLPTLDTTPLQGQTWLQDYSPVAYDPYIGTMTQMSDDPTSIANENLALAQMQKLAQGGLQPADLVALQQIQQAQAGSASSQGAATQAALQARGLGGAGAAEAGQLAANQSAANTANSTYNNALQTAMQRQIAAITNAGGMASNIRSQDANISQQMANISNAFNTQVQNLRTDAAKNAAAISNSAQAANLAGRQSVANANVATANQNVALQNSIAQQNFQNQNTKISGQSAALNNQANYAGQQQAALNQQALGQQQATTAGLSGLTNLAKTFSGDSSNSTSPSWMQSLSNYVTGAGNDTMTSDYGTAQYTPGATSYIDSGSW